jgi:hypothetical protein
MKVFLDGQPLPTDRATIACALRQAVDAAAARGRIIIEATAGGEPLPEHALETPPEERYDGELRFVSVEPRAMVRVTLQDAGDALDQARDAQSRCAKLIQSGKTDESLAPLGQAIGTWQLVRDAVEKSMAILGGGSAPAPSGLSDLVNELGGRLEEVKRSLGMQDWSALADTLAYDMDEQAGKWKDMLAGMADSLRPGD